MPSTHPSSQNVKVAVDAVIFTVRDGELSVLLIQMKKKSFSGDWALPGGLIDEKETTKRAAARILKEQTGMTDVFLEQLATFDDAKRDPLGRVISVAYFALIPDAGIKLRTTEKYADVGWRAVADIRNLAYDHRRILDTAVARLRGRLEYTNIAWSLLPPLFPLSRLQEIYETILGRKLDKRNFRKRVLALGLVASTGKTEKGGAHRPAELFAFRQKKLKIIQVL